MKEQDDIDAAVALAALRYLATNVYWDQKHQQTFTRLNEQLNDLLQAADFISPEIIVNHLDMKYSKGTMQ